MRPATIARSPMRPVVLIIAVLVAATSGQAFDPEPRVELRWTLVNGEGEDVGPGLDFSNTTAGLTAIKTDDTVLLVQLSPDRVLGGTVGLVFESGDCSGPPLINVPPGVPPPVVPLTALGPSGLVVATASVSLRTPQSVFDSAQSPPCFGLVSGPELLADTAPATLPARVTPPFSLRVAAGPLAQRHDTRLVVEDSRGRLIGSVSGLSEARGFLPVRLGPPASLLVLAAADRLVGRAAVVFESADCSGPPLLEAPNGEGSLAAVAGTSPDGALVVPAGPPSAGLVAVGSVWIAQLTPPACQAEAFLARLAPVAPGPDVSGFVPPFRPRLVATGADGLGSRGPAGPLLLRDADGRVLGPVTHEDEGGQVTVLLEAEGRRALVRVTPTGFVGGVSRTGQSVRASFEAPGCAGPALLPDRPHEVAGESFFPGSVIDRDVLRIGVGSASTKTIQSQWDPELKACQDLGGTLTDDFSDTEVFATLGDVPLPPSLF